MTTTAIAKPAHNGNSADARQSFASTTTIMPVPDLLQVQRNSFEWFMGEGLRDLFEEISPIEDAPGKRFELTFSNHHFGKHYRGREEEGVDPKDYKGRCPKVDLDDSGDYAIGPHSFIIPGECHKDCKGPKYTEEECREKEITYSAPLYVDVTLEIKAAGTGSGEIKGQELFVGDVPMMTQYGTFVINGAERVVVSQLVRSPGVYFTAADDPNTGRKLAAAKLIPYRGAWMEFETSNRDVISVKVDRKRKTPISTLLRAMGYDTNQKILDLFEDVDTNAEHEFVRTTIDRDTAVVTQQDALEEFYRRLRPGEPVNTDNARTLIDNLFYNERRYDLGRVGRYKLNNSLGRETPSDPRVLEPEDIITLIRTMIRINNDEVTPSDIDHLGNRRVRAVGELIQNQIRVGLMRMERVIRERMTTQIDPATTSPAALINIRPVVAAVREFFGGSQLSQFMDQTNPLAELTHKRRLSALGPGGLSRERAGFEVRDVHHSHYGRICPIETPEGPNIGLLGSLATYARTNAFGFIETPYRRVFTEIASDDPDIAGRELRQDIRGDDGKNLLTAGKVVNARYVNRIRALPRQMIKVKPYVSDDPATIEYLSADKEEGINIAQSTTKIDEKGQFVDERVATRRGEDIKLEAPENIGYMDVSPMQLVSVSTALIPFLEHDDANRALMGSNMQRQAVPLLRPEPPLVGTGLEGRVARDSGQLIVSDVDGVVVEAIGSRIVVKDKERKTCAYSLVSGRDGKDGDANLQPTVKVGDKVTRGEIIAENPSTEKVRVCDVDDGDVIEINDDSIIVEYNPRVPHKLRKFLRSNQGTCINQRAIVSKGDVVKKGDILADSSSTGRGELALGQNVLVAFMSWGGYNFEDAIILSRRLVKDDKFTSIHIEKHEVEARETKLGPEDITRDIPNVGEESLRNLDEDGIIRVGAEIKTGDILVGKITPKGETELSAEEKLLRAIFGEKARDVKDTSLRVPHGERGKVISVSVLDSANKDDMSPGVKKMVRIWIAQTRKITEGDKMAGRHGNKGVVAKILPEEDMPFLPDGTPVDIILNPIGVPSRMNLGQVLETHLGWAAGNLGFKADTQVFDGAKDTQIEDALAQAWIIDRSGAVDVESDDGDGMRRIDMGAVRAWLARRGYDYDAAFGEGGVPGEASRACLETWLREDVPEDVRQDVGVSTEDNSLEALRALAQRLNREKQIAAPTLGKSVLYDGRTGEAFDQPIAVGYIYMMKLIHLVEDKIHARSTGPYSLITQQPLGGKAQFGGQRFGEMEVWALEAYSAANNLQEMLTLKSDDVIGRVKTYEAIVKGENVTQPGVPESFHVLMKELQSLGLSVELMHETLSDQFDDDLGGLDDFTPSLGMADDMFGPKSLFANPPPAYVPGDVFGADADGGGSAPGASNGADAAATTADEPVGAGDD